VVVILEQELNYIIIGVRGKDESVIVVGVCVKKYLSADGVKKSGSNRSGQAKPTANPVACFVRGKCT